MEDGLSTSKKEQKALKIFVSVYCRTYNKALKAEEGAGGGGLDMNEERGKAYQAIEDGADINAVKERFKERTGEDLN